MRLAEALMLRSDCQTRIRELKDRIVRNARVQEGDTPSEDPQRLLEELDRVVDQLEDLIRRINKTNAAVPVEGVGTVTDALARRDVVGKKLYVLREVAKEATSSVDRYLRSELKQVSTVNVAGLHQQADGLAREWRELDALIQAANWSADLLG